MITGSLIQNVFLAKYYLYYYYNLYYYLKSFSDNKILVHQRSKMMIVIKKIKLK